MKKAVTGILITTMLLSTAGLTGCFCKNKEKVPGWIEDGKKIAIDYLEDKYDTDDIEIIDAKCQTYAGHNFETIYSPNVIMKAEVDGEECTVYVKNNGDDDDDVVKDDLQKEQITKDIEDIISESTDMNVKEIRIEYAFDSSTRLDGLVTERYDVKKKASKEDKIKALRRIFVDEQDKFNGRMESVQIVVQLFCIEDNVEGMGDDIDFIVRNVFGFENVDFYELAFKSDKDYKALKDEIGIYPAYSMPTYGESLNGYAHLAKSTGYKGKMDVESYTFVEGKEFNYLVVNADPDELNMESKKASKDTFEASGKKYDVISKEYTIDIPADAEVYIFVDDEDVKVVDEYKKTSGNKGDHDGIAYYFSTEKERVNVYQVGRFGEGEVTFYLVEK